MSAIPTGSLAPDSPSTTVPLGPSISCWPRTENTTAGSVGAMAVATRNEEYQSSRTTACRNSATPTAVTNVPSTPTRPMVRAALRNLGKPMPMPPSNRMNASATLTTRSTVSSGGASSDGRAWTATAAATRRSTAAGIRNQRVTWYDSSATRPTSAARNSSQANVRVSAMSLLRSAGFAPSSLTGRPDFPALRRSRYRCSERVHRTSGVRRTPL